MIAKKFFNFHITLFLLSFSIVIPLQGITIVYNLRIAETTKSQIKSLVKLRHSIAAVTAFAQFRKLLKTAHQSALGALGTYVYMGESFYARINAAVGNVHTSIEDDPATFSRTQLDDILFTTGYAMSIHDCLKMAFSVHLGIPTHEDTSLQALQFGTGHVGLGGQLDAVLSLSAHQQILAAARFIHFFPREVDLMFNNLEHELDFGLGNVADLMFVYQHTWKLRHQVEVGYNPTFIFDASINPPLPGVLEQINSTTHNIFGSYRYGFLIKKKYPSAIIVGTSVGLSPKPEAIGNTQIVTAWLSWGINF